MNELIEILKTGSWITFAGFGAYLAYKLAVVTVISVTVLKTIGKIVQLLTNGREVNQRLLQLIASAGMRYPLTQEEWEELIKRVRQQ